MSTTTTSRPRASAAEMASKATAAGSAPRWEPTKSAPARSAQISSCSSAAARNVSAAASTTERPDSCSRWASLPIVVVFPVPLTPTTRTTVRRPVEAEPLLPLDRDEIGDDLLQAVDELGLARGLALLEALHDLDRRGDAAVGRDQRLLDPLPRLVVARVEEELARERLPARGQRLAQAAEPAAPLLLVLVTGASSRSPRNSAQLRVTAVTR